MPMNSDRITVTGTSCRTVALPTAVLPGQTWEVKTSEPVQIDPGFREVAIQITVSPPRATD